MLQAPPTLEKLKAKLTLDPVRVGEALEFYAKWRGDYGAQILEALLQTKPKDLAVALPKLSSVAVDSFKNMVKQLAALLDVDEQEVVSLFSDPEPRRPSITARRPRDPLEPYKNIFERLSPESKTLFRTAFVASLVANHCLDHLAARGERVDEDADSYLRQALFCRMALGHHAATGVGLAETVEALPRVMTNRVLVALELIESNHPGLVPEQLRADLPPVVHGTQEGESDHDWEPDSETAARAKRLADKTN